MVQVKAGVEKKAAASHVKMLAELSTEAQAFLARTSQGLVNAPEQER